jgi:hypothetical protein
MGVVRRAHFEYTGLISLNTTKTHMRNILAKLHATSRHQAAAYAVQEGLIRPPDQGSVLHE